MGHAEPAAGIAGLLGALSSIGSAQLQPILHLRSVNAHVAAALQQHQQLLPATPAAVHIARQLASKMTGLHDEALTGCSAFAFQVGPCHFSNHEQDDSPAD